MQEALSQPKARDGIAALLRGAADSLTDKCNPSGCLLVHGVAGAGEHAECIRQELNARRAASEKVIRARPLRRNGNERHGRAGSRWRFARRVEARCRHGYGRLACVRSKVVLGVFELGVPALRLRLEQQILAAGFQMNF